MISEDLTFYLQKNPALLTRVQRILKLNDVLERNSLISITNVEGIITYVNDITCMLSGYSNEELIGNTFRIINSGLHPKIFFKELWDIILSGKVWKGEVCNKSKKGELYWVDTVITPLKNDLGYIDQFVVLRTDITKRKIAEKLLEKSNVLLDTIINTTQNVQVVFDAETHKIVYFNKVASKFAENVFQKEIQLDFQMELLIPEIFKKTFKRIITFCKNRKYFNFETNFTSKLGENSWIKIGLSLMTECGTENDGISMVLIDITARKNAELELSRYNQQLEKTVEKRTQQWKNAFHLIDRKNDEMLKSIEYASTIQRSMFPSDSSLAHQFKDFFVLYQPKDIVSGDFYYFEETKFGYYLAVGDCTGHGIPGSLLTMFALKSIRDIIAKLTIMNPAFVLSEMSKEINHSLHETIQDGLDLSLIFLSKNLEKLVYSGANNGMYLIRDNQLSIFRGDRMGLPSVGEYEFSNHIIDLQKDDQIYLYTDGFADQFGCAAQDRQKTKKVLKSRFREHILANSFLNMESQKQSLIDYHKAWRGFKEEQTDDILVIGLQI